MARYTKKNPKQLGLSFDGTEPVESDAENANAKIARHVTEFVRQVSASSGTFQMADLQKYVAERVPGTKGESAARILRLLRDKGTIDYECIDARKALYEVY